MIRRLFTWIASPFRREKPLTITDISRDPIADMRRAVGGISVDGKFLCVGAQARWQNQAQGIASVTYTYERLGRQCFWKIAGRTIGCVAR